METKIEFVSYKKLIIFGSEGAGKTSLTSRLESGSFKEESPSTDCKIFFSKYIL
jgi:GTPase SAR1 family protein